MSTFLIFLAVSCALFVTLLIRGYLRLKTFPREELLLRFNLLKPFWQNFEDLLVTPGLRLHREKVKPAVYKEIEKLARRFRIILLRVECLLMRFTEYIRGKRVICGNGHKSHYWEQLNNCKNGVSKEEGAGVTQRPE